MTGTSEFPGVSWCVVGEVRHRDWGISGKANGNIGRGNGGVPFIGVSIRTVCVGIVGGIKSSIPYQTILLST